MVNTTLIFGGEIISLKVLLLLPITPLHAEHDEIEVCLLLNEFLKTYFYIFKNQISLKVNK
jgi:hypothetical protein